MVDKSFYKVLFLSKEISGSFYFTILAFQSGFFEVDQVPMRGNFCCEKMDKEWGKYNNENSGVFLAILTLLLGFFEIDRIFIKRYFLVKKKMVKKGGHRNLVWVML